MMSTLKKNAGRKGMKSRLGCTCGRELGALKPGVGAGPKEVVFGQRPGGEHSSLRKTHLRGGKGSPQPARETARRPCGSAVRGTGAEVESAPWGLGVAELQEDLGVFFHMPRSSREWNAETRQHRG